MTIASFPAEPLAVREAREFVLAAASVPSSASADVALVVSEVVANAVLHARSPFVVNVVRRGDVLRVEVTDESPSLPVPSTYGTDAATGRGLKIIEALTRRWGAVPGPDAGKTVWFEMSLDGEA